MKHFSFLTLFFMLLIYDLSGQQMIWEESFNGATWPEFISKAEKRYPVHFYYTDSIPPITTFHTSGSDFISALNAVLARKNLKAVPDLQNNIFITKTDSSFKAIPGDFFKNSSVQNGIKKTNGTGHSNGFMQMNQALAEQKVTIGKINNDNKTRATVSGYVRNAGDNSPIIGVLIRIEGSNAAVLSDVSGFYSLQIEKGDRMMIAGNIETKEKRISMRVLSDGRLDIQLEPKLVTLNAVIISAGKEQIVKSTQMGYQRLATKEIKEIPVILGEQDVIKVSLLLPGIQSVGEGTSGVNVRGSPTDQNLFIINNIPVYNSSHLLGFFSAFNSDAIKDFELYKNNMPAHMGGRLSSIFDIRTKQGNQNNFTAQGGVSPVTARLTVEGPISKKKSSYLLAVRSTYSNWILRQIDEPEINKSNAGFADAITDFTFDLNSNNRLHLSSYHSTDKINLIEENKYNYANNGGSVSWTHLFREKNNYNLSIIYSQYDFTERNAEKEFSAYRDNFSLQHTELKSGYTMRPSEKHTINVGVNAILYLADQGKFAQLNDASLVTDMNLEKEKALESALYLSDEWAISKKFTITGSLRYNYYAYLGPQKVRLYKENETRSLQNIRDTVSFGNNEVIKTYQSPDLRFSTRYLVTDGFSIKMSYTRMHQYLFMLSNTIAISPTDKWKLSDYHIRPMSGDQYSFGIYNTLFNGKLDITTEAYYKNVKNLVDFKNGANLVVNEAPETDVVQGNLEAYGIEFMINKPKGRFNGWLNYTWSKTMVTVNSPFKEEQINNNQSFPSNYDKPHAVNLVANYKFSRRFSISSNVVYSTGRPITYPVGFFNQDNIRIPLYSERNEYRIPDYFRMDLSIKVEGNLASEKLAHGTWILSVYNLTARRNAYSIFYRYEDGTMKGYKMSIFAIPVVSLTYSFKLGNYAN